MNEFEKTKLRKKTLQLFGICLLVILFFGIAMAGTGLQGSGTFIISIPTLISLGIFLIVKSINLYKDSEKFLALITLIVGISFVTYIPIAMPAVRIGRFITEQFDISPRGYDFPVTIFLLLVFLYIARKYLKRKN